MELRLGLSSGSETPNDLDCDEMSTFLELEAVCSSQNDFVSINAVFVFAFYFERQGREVLGEISRGLLVCPRQP